MTLTIAKIKKIWAVLLCRAGLPWTDSSPRVNRTRAHQLLDIIAIAIGKGLCLDYLGKYEEALACYDRALEIKPDLYNA